MCVLACIGDALHTPLLFVCATNLHKSALHVHTYMHTCVLTYMCAHACMGDTQRTPCSLYVQPMLIRSRHMCTHTFSRTCSHVHVCHMCTRTSHVHTYVTCTHVRHMCTRTSHVHTYVTCAHVRHMYTRTSHVHTYVTCAYVRRMCTRELQGV